MTNASIYDDVMTRITVDIVCKTDVSYSSKSMYVYIYIYIERERDRYTYMHMYIYIYIHILKRYLGLRIPMFKRYAPA